MQKLISAGIDIGTTTTHLVITRLVFDNIALQNQTAKMAVVEREILYESPIHLTPLTDDDLVDAEAVAKLVEAEYRKAGFNSFSIQSGAVIVTGETARKRNARQLSEAIAHLAGNFVVASAGWHLEGALAGRGSGAAEASKTGQVICNIDIGGGTSNYAVFRDGELIDSACLELGGRCIKFDNDGNVIDYTEAGENFLNNVAKLSLLPLGSPPAAELLDLVGALLSDVILYIVRTPKPPPVVLRSMISEPLRHDYKIDQVWFSGGVANLIDYVTNSPSNLNESYKAKSWEYNDFGYVLARSLHATLVDRAFPYKLAHDGIRATVLGAGLHTLQLSGFTIDVCEDILPLRNVPIAKPFQATEIDLSSAEIQDRINQNLYLSELFIEEALVAIAIVNIAHTNYETLKIWARGLIEAHLARTSSQPLIILSQDDVALALGQTIRTINPHVTLLILDGVDTTMGDYIDIGVPLPSSQSLPLTVKSLIFSN